MAERDRALDWSRLTVILLKPDCLARDLVTPVLAWVGRHVQVSDLRVIEPTERQIFAHYDDILDLSARLGVDVPGELRRIYVGQRQRSRSATAPTPPPGSGRSSATPTRRSQARTPSAVTSAPTASPPPAPEAN